MLILIVNVDCNSCCLTSLMFFFSFLSLTLKSPIFETTHRQFVFGFNCDLGEGSLKCCENQLSFSLDCANDTSQQVHHWTFCRSALTKFQKRGIWMNNAFPALLMFTQLRLKEKFSASVLPPSFYSLHRDHSDAREY